MFPPKRGRGVISVFGWKTIEYCCPVVFLPHVYLAIAKQLPLGSLWFILSFFLVVLLLRFDQLTLYPRLAHRSCAFPKVVTYFRSGYPSIFPFIPFGWTAVAHRLPHSFLAVSLWLLMGYSWLPPGTGIRNFDWRLPAQCKECGGSSASDSFGQPCSLRWKFWF